MNRFFMLFIFGVICSTSIISQEEKKNNNPWVLGFALSAIDDSGTQLSKPFDFNKNYHFTNPYKFFVEKRFKDNYGLDLSLSFNSFKKGKLYNQAVLEESISFFATDLSMRYYITNLFLDKYRSYFEGFTFAGLGGSFYDWQGAMTFNLGAGLNIYASNHLRLFAQASGKLAINQLINGTNYFQYDLGVIYRLPSK